MKPIRLDQDVRPLSEFRAGMSAFIQQVAETRRPLLLTQNGRGVAVLLDVREFEDLRDELEVVRSVVQGLLDVKAGRVIPHEEAMQQVLDEVKSMERPAP